MRSQMMSIAVASAALPLFAAIKLATPFADHAVLQREREVPVWGWATAGSQVTVGFADAEVSCTAGTDGRWQVKLPPMAASKESRELTVVEATPGFLWDDETDRVTVRDVLVGEVWMCSGQSNTECPIWGKSPRYRDGWGAMTLTSVNKPFVRLTKTPCCASTTPNLDVKAVWRAMTPELYDGYVKNPQVLPSAIGYYFALELANALDIPIGIVDSSWGGTNIDAWTPREGYEGMDTLKDVAALPALEKAAFEAARANGVYKGKSIYGSVNQQPTVLWNGMVAAFAPMAIRGFIWYQGCHNAHEYQRYCDKMHALYNGWSKAFANPDLKLYFVQIAPWGTDVIADIQMAQAKFEAEEPHAGMAVINDTGNLTDIHPNDKRTVGKRLSLFALARDYGWTSVKPESPTFVDMKTLGSSAVLRFKHADGWYVYNHDRLSFKTGFELCGADGVWKPAEIVNFVKHKGRDGKPYTQGVLQGKNIILEAKGVDNPVRVRYLRNRPWFGAVYNERCLPLGAFESK